MIVKKYPQSNLIISKGQTKIVIDPGSYTFQKGFRVEDLQGADGYLITHQHQDHLDMEHIKEVALNKPIYANEDVCQKLSGLGLNIIEINNGQTFKVGDFEIKAIDLPHGKTLEMPDMPQNTGYLIDGVLFHPGDGVSLKGLTSENFALPIAGPGASFKSALQFAKDLNAKMIIPIHFDSTVYKADPKEFAPLAQNKGIEVRILEHGQETEI